MKKTNYILIIICSILLFSFIQINFSFAETNSNKNVQDIQNTMNNSTTGNIDNVINVNDPFNVTFDTEVADKADEWINFKASQVIRIIQSVGKWIAFGVFIICGLKTVVGVFGKGDKVGKGVLGMIIAAICFVVIQYADIIFQFILNFIIK